MCIIDFACYCILIRFNICRMILKSVASYSYAELTDNNIRFAEYEEQSQIRSRSNEGCQSIIFGATTVSLRGYVADVGIL